MHRNSFYCEQIRVSTNCDFQVNDTNGVFYKNTVIVSLIDEMIPLVDVWMGPIL